MEVTKTTRTDDNVVRHVRKPKATKDKAKAKAKAKAPKSSDKSGWNEAGERLAVMAARRRQEEIVQYNNRVREPDVVVNYPTGLRVESGHTTDSVETWGLWHVPEGVWMVKQVKGTWRPQEHRFISAMEADAICLAMSKLPKVLDKNEVDATEVADEHQEETQPVEH